MDEFYEGRRTFLKRSLIAGVAMALPTASASSFTAPSSKIRLGGQVYSPSKDPGELARAHRQLGYRAGYCPQVRIADAERIKAIREAYQKEDVVIAEVGRWVNLLDADPVKRKANLELVTEGMAIADAVEARCCVDIAGSYSKSDWYGPHPDNLSKQFFDAAVENARKIIDSVKPKKTKFCYEMMGWSIPDSADSYLRLIKAVDRAAFAVHLDPCNAINSPALFYDNTRLLNDLYDKLGRWIVSVHAKDLKWIVENNVHFKEVIPGTGSLDYATLLKRHAALPGEVPLMIEHLANAAEYDQARGFIVEEGKKLGISFN